ncbi:MAG: hypothetical protein PHW95_02560 [Patescibacteria group bacterium]|nr:hypothetical protein [Patescibacteria group bacterium]
MHDSEKFKEAMKSMPDNSIDDFTKNIVKFLLKFNDEQINTVSFVFWLVYVAELKLDEFRIHAWEVAEKDSSEDIIDRAKQMLTDKINLDRSVINNPRYFSEKIKFFEGVIGKNDFVEILYILRDLRNDISHLRIDNLKYKELSLYTREAKENLIIDFVESARNCNASKSDFRQFI